MLTDAKPTRRLPLVLLALTCGPLLAGCESARFGGLRSPSGPPARVAEVPVDPITPSVPSGSVTSEPLGPPPGGGVPVLAGRGSEVEPLSGSPPPVQTLGGSPASSAPSSRTAAVGGWTARDASGSCRVNLSSTPSLDLYRASAGACANKELSRVTSWDFRDGEVFLFQPGGAVAARLRPGGSGLSGVLAKSGAPLSLTRG